MKALLALGRPASGAGPGLIPEFFEAFFEGAGDPDVDLAPWVRSRAPLGVLRPVTSRGVFPPVLEEAPAAQRGVDSFTADPDGWENYRSTEDDLG
eukprot:5193150-Alexandrium_andersonii.AAC.1